MRSPLSKRYFRRTFSLHIRIMKCGETLLREDCLWVQRILRQIQCIKHFRYTNKYVKTTGRWKHLSNHNVAIFTCNCSRNCVENAMATRPESYTKIPNLINLVFTGPCIILIVENKRPTWCHLLFLFLFLCVQHVSDINISIIRSLRLFCRITTLVVCSWFTVCWYYGVAGLAWYPCSRLKQHG